MKDYKNVTDWRRCKNCGRLHVVVGCDNYEPEDSQNDNRVIGRKNKHGNN